MRVFALLVAAVTAIAAVAYAQQPVATDNLLQSMLSTGKMSGACGILKLQTDFQTTTAMPGGNEFVIRFWTTEAARLGHSLTEYIEVCKTSVKTFDQLWQIAENK